MVHWGYSNVVRFQSEWLRGGGSVPGACNVGIYDFISEHGLMDLPLIVGHFTRSNNQETLSMS